MTDPDARASDVAAIPPLFGLNWWDERRNKLGFYTLNTEDRNAINALRERAVSLLAQVEHAAQEEGLLKAMFFQEKREKERAEQTLRAHAARVQALEAAAREWLDYTKPAREEWMSDAAYVKAGRAYDRLAALLASDPEVPHD